VGISNLASERIDNGGAGSVQPVSLFDDSLSAPALTKTGMIFLVFIKAQIKP
jgi:hypothetical protein